MCGIAGILSTRRPENVEESVLRRMCGALAHRGPDDEGVCVSEVGEGGRIGLGNRRLSILDIPRGRQPMSNEDGSIWITYNGEIYNFRDIRSRLSGQHRFKTDSDTEVILHLYEERGIECLQELRGMFAFAVWDGRRRRLFCARDRLGKKPLVYYSAPGRFVFASEIKAILECPDVPREILPAALDSYLTYQYVPHPLTIFKGISKLPPAHYLVLEGGQVRVERYWTPLFGEDESLSEESCIARLREVLSESVRLRLISDVPLGVFLSGGVDSSIVAGLMSRVGAERVKTFSIGFEERRYDELKYARMVARAFNTEHHEFVVRPKAAEVIPKLLAQCDEPFADSSAIPTYYLSQVTRQHVKVALSGEGGDECFLGYPRYQAMKLGALFDRLPGVLKRAATWPGWQRALASVEQKTLRRRIKRLLEGFALPPVARYLDWISIFTEAEKLRLYTPDFAASRVGARPDDFVRAEMERWARLGDAARAGAADMVTYLPCDLLHKVDMASMANSLEVRCPFLDHHVVEFCARIPDRLRLRGLTRKYVLKKAFADLLPPPVRRRGKMGFGAPIAQWFREELSDYLRQVLLDPRARSHEYFRAEVVQELVESHIAGRADHGHRLWALVMFELWRQKYLG